MDSLSLEDFVPFYPLLSSNQQWNNVYNPALTPQEAFSLKKEFTSPVNDFPTAVEEDHYLMHHQKIIARFLANHTVYDGLLVFHQMGLGKTRAVIGAIELAHQNASVWDPPFPTSGTLQNRALILVKGKTVERNFINELLKALPGKYEPEGIDELTDLEKVIRINKKITPFYDIQTFETFAKRVSEMSESVIARDYSYRVIVIDEAHHLRFTKTKGLSVYSEIERFLSIVKGCKKVALTGTPMRDQPSELASVMNLILPSKSRLPMGKEFMNQFYNKQGVVNGVNIPTLKKFLQGRVSFVQRPPPENVKVVYQGKTGIDARKGARINHFILSESKMSPLQSKGYQEAYLIDFRKSGKVDDIPISTGVEEAQSDKVGIYSNSRQAADFVFPDGTYGQDGFKRHIILRKGGLRDKATYSLSNAVITFLRKNGGSNDNKLSALAEMSCKYAAIVKEILDHPKENVFVSTEFVQGGGAILFSKILQQFGFTQSNGSEHSPGRRYAFITGGTAAGRAQRLLEYYNNPRNKYGDYSQVIIGSRVISEAISLFNTRQFHNLDPYWNYAEIEQSLYRLLRTFAYSGLLEDLPSVNVRIFLHAAVPIKGLSVDLWMYYLSEVKDLLIKQLVRVLRETAVDCYLNKQVNEYPQRYDLTRECEYLPCAYRCDGIRGEVMSKSALITDTFSLFYSEGHIQWVIKKLGELFTSRFTLGVSDLFAYFPSYPKSVVVHAVLRAITSHTTFQDPYGFSCFLSENGGVLYLTKSMKGQGVLDDSYYTKHPSIVIRGSGWEDLSEWILLDTIDKVCRKSVTYPEARAILPLDIQSLFLEQAIISKKLKQTKNVSLRGVILTEYAPYIHQIGSTWVNTLSTPRCLQQLEWTGCSKEVVRDLHQQKESVIDRNAEYFGIVTKKGAFKIFETKRVKENTDRRKNLRGLACPNMEKKDLARMVLKLQVAFPDAWELHSDFIDKVPKHPIVVGNGYTKGELDKMPEEVLGTVAFVLQESKPKACKHLREWFIKHKLVMFE